MSEKFTDIPNELWDRVQVWIPKRRRGPAGGRPPKSDRQVMRGILFRLRTGCQWEAVPKEFGSRSTLYRRFVQWTKAGVFKMMHVEMLLFYDEERGIAWDWASLDSAIVKAPKGGTSRVPTRPIGPRPAPNGTSSLTDAAFRSR